MYLGSQAFLLIAKNKSQFIYLVLKENFFLPLLVPVECKIPRFVQFLNKDSSAVQTNKTPGKLRVFLSPAP